MKITIFSQSFYSVSSDFLVKWSAKEHVRDTGQKSLACTEGMIQAKSVAHNVRFLSIGMENTVHAADVY